MNQRTDFQMFMSMRWLMLLGVAGLIFMGLWGNGADELPLALPALPQKASMPLAFEPNVGQSDTAVLYQARGLGGNLFFTQTGISYALPDDVVAEMSFVGANEGAAVTAVSPLLGQVNYFQGSDPAGWQQNVPTFEAVRYEGLYAGIDALFDGQAGTLKGTYFVAPHGDPSQIRWHYPNALGVSVDAAGNLLVGLAGADAPLVERTPVAWQEVDGVKTAVVAEFAVAADGTVGFALGAYDSALPLIIDPTVTFSSFYGGSTEECLFARCAITTDAAGNIYLTGTTRSADFPTVNPFASDTPDGTGDDIFIVKMAPNGTVVYSTYIANGEGLGIAVDATGNVYVTGSSIDTNFPTTATKISDCTNGRVDIVVVKLSSDGSDLLYSSCLGSSGIDRGYDIVVDGDNNMIVTGFATGDDFPTKNAAQASRKGREDAVLFKLNAAGSALIFSTYWGGDRRDWAYAVDLDDAGNVYFGGRASSDDFPTTAGVVRPAANINNDGFVVKVSPAGAVLYSTLTAVDAVSIPNRELADLAVDGAGNVYLLELGTRFKGVRKFNPTATQQLYQTEIEIGFLVAGKSGLAIDSQGRVVVVGQRAGDFDAGDQDLLVAGLTENGRLVYEEVFGHNDFARGLGVALHEHDGQLDAYIVGETDDAQFPTKNAVQATLNGPRDMVVLSLTNLQEKLVANDVYLPFVIR